MRIGNEVARAPRAYRVLLHLFPRGFRERHGADMEELFVESLHGAGSRARAARVWAAAGADLLLRAPIEHWRGWTPITSPVRRSFMLTHDVRYALRAFRRQPAIMGMVVGMLALGVASNTTVFTLINGVYLRPLPFDDSDRLVYLNERAPRWNLDFTSINYPDFHRWREDAQAFEGMALVDDTEANLTEGDRAERVQGLRVTYDFLDVLGLEPVAGRMFTADEDRPNGARVVLIGENMWRTRFGGDRDILGRTVRLNSAPYTVIGVLPAAAAFPNEADIWLPLQGDPLQPWRSYSYDGIGRLKPGVTIERAQQDLLRAHEPIFAEHDQERIVTPLVMPLRERYVGGFRTALIALGAAVAIVLLIACANVASLMLARSIARHREIGIRLAMGAGRGHLMRQLSIENLVLALAGGVLGLIGGAWVSRVLVSSIPDQFPDWVRFDLDARIVAFSVLLAVATAILFGLAPALQTFRADVRGALQEGGPRTTAGASGRRTLGFLIAAEVALSAVLLVGGGLFLRAYQRFGDVDPGFRAENVLTFTVALPAATYDTDERRTGFWDELVTRLPALPGVEQAGAINCLPLTCHLGHFFEIEGAAPLGPNDPDPVVLNRVVTPGYFGALGIQLVNGRFFDESDGRDAGNRAIIVNEAFVRQFWPDDTDPLGKRMRFRGNSEDPWMTVVGIARDVKHYGLDEPMIPGVYQPLTQQGWHSDMSLALRARSDPGSLAAGARQILQEMDADLPMYLVGTMEEALRSSLALRETYSWLLSIFAAAALLLALGGIYGATSYAASGRRREIGIRIALGARADQVMQLVLRSGMTLVVVGVVVGLLAAYVAARALSSVLFGVTPSDPLVYGAVALVLLGTALAANYVPARKASKISPTTSLTAE